MKKIEETNVLLNNINITIHPDIMERILLSIYKNATNEILILTHIKSILIDDESIDIYMDSEISVQNIFMLNIDISVLKKKYHSYNCIIHNHFTHPEFTESDYNALREYPIALLFYNNKFTCMSIKKSVLKHMDIQCKQQTKGVMYG